MRAPGQIFYLPWSYLLGIALLSLIPLSAQAEFTCRAEVDRETTVVGGTISLSVQIEGSITGSLEFILPPEIERLVSGTSYSRSQTISGNRSSVAITKSYYLTPRETGELVIGPVVVQDQQGQCQTEQLKVKILAAGQTPPTHSISRSPAPGETSNDDAQSNDDDLAAGGSPGDDVFITLEVDKDEAWVGQQLILTFRYFRRTDPWSNPQFTAPRTAGFWREELGPQRDFRATVSGRAYNVTEIKYAIFPTHAGALTIEPAEISFSDSGLNRFFSTRRRQGPRQLRTQSLTVAVKELPAGKPDDFSGLVAGRLLLTAQTNRDTVPRGEPIDYQVRLVSDAFLKTFEDLSVQGMDGVRMHDAGEDFRTNIEQQRLMGQVTVEKILVPEVEGPVDLPDVRLSWFDTNSEEYRVARAQVPTAMVLPSDNPYPEQEDSGFLRSQISRLGQDLVFIHNVPDGLHTRSATLVRRPVWWLMLILPLVLLVGWRFYLGRRLSDPVILRRRRALSQAMQRLAAASKQEDMSLVARAITHYVADRVNRPSAAIDSAAVRAYGRAVQNPAAAERLAEILESCDMARYGGDGSFNYSPELGKEVEDHLHSMERGAPKDGPRTALWAFLLFGLVFLSMPASAVSDPARLMAEGNQAYTDGKVEMAREFYSQAVELGAEDADLYFNLGNAHARLGELGYAVANYLRAQRLAPRDQDIRDNLTWVRGNIQDLELNESELPLFIAQLVAVVFSFTLNQWATFLVLMVWLLAFLLAWQRYRGHWSDVLRRWFLLAGGVTLIVAAIVLWRFQVEEVKQTAVVVASEVAVRSGPDSSFPVQFQVHDGLTIQVQEERPGWVRINLGGESLGWMPEVSVERVRR